MKDKIKKQQKKIIYATGGIVASLAIAFAGKALVSEASAQNAKEYQTLIDLENPDFKINLDQNESFIELLERFGYKVTDNVKSLNSKPIYEMYSLVWNAENNKNQECNTLIQEKLEEFKETLLSLAEKRVYGSIESIDGNTIVSTQKPEETSQIVTPGAVHKGLAYADAVYDEKTGKYVWKYTINRTFEMKCEDEDLLLLIKYAYQKDKDFSNKDILKAISAYIRVLGSEYQYIYTDIKEKNINAWLNTQKVEYTGSIINVTKYTENARESIFAELQEFKKYLLNYYSIENIEPNECRVSKINNSWYLVIDSTQEKYMLNEYFSNICKNIAGIQTDVSEIEQEDYTESMVPEYNSSVIRANVSKKLEKVNNSYSVIK